MPKISAYPAGTPLQASDKFVIARGGQNYYILGSEFMPQTGGLRNGKISVTVAGGNITLALKTLAGANPSASDPVLVYLGGAWRAVTAPLSVTKNAGTNWMNLGGSELQTREADLFPYLGYNSIDGVVIAFSRIPFGSIYSDFSTTNTNEKYAAISTITSASANDEYQVIGRFAATLSAGAAYTWSVPTYTAANLIQRPIYETRILTAASVTTGFSADYAREVKYQIVGRQMWYDHRATGVGTSNATGFTVTLPFQPSITTVYVSGLGADSGTQTVMSLIVNAATTAMTLCKGASTVAATWTASGDKYAELSIWIPIG